MAGTNTQVLELALARRQGLARSRDVAGDAGAGDRFTALPQAAPDTSLRGRMRARVTQARRDAAAAAAIDTLRTRLLQALKANGWRRVGITAPTSGCGKSFLTASLALGLARLEDVRTVAVDLDLRAPRLHEELGLRASRPVAEWLDGRAGIDEAFFRVGRNLAVALAPEALPDASERLQRSTIGPALDAMAAALCPDVALFDLPAVLGTGDGAALLSHVDAVLLVSDATATRADEIAACEAQFRDRVPLLGVVLNKAAPGMRGT